MVTVLEYQSSGRRSSLVASAGGGQFTEAGGATSAPTCPMCSPTFVASGFLCYPSMTVCRATSSRARAPMPPCCPVGPGSCMRTSEGVTVSSSLNHYLYKAGFDADTVLDAAWPDPGNDPSLRRSDGWRDAQTGRLLRCFPEIGPKPTANVCRRRRQLALCRIWPITLATRIFSEFRGGNQRLPGHGRGPWRRQNCSGAPVVSIAQSKTGVKVRTRDITYFPGRPCDLDHPVLRPRRCGREPGVVVTRQNQNVSRFSGPTRSKSWYRPAAPDGWRRAFTAIAHGGFRTARGSVIDITGNEPGGYGNLFSISTIAMRRPTSTNPPTRADGILSKCSSAISPD